MHAILKKLQGGDRRSIGKADEGVDQVLGSTPLFEDWCDCIAKLKGYGIN